MKKEQIEQLKEKANKFMAKHWTFLQEVDCYEFLAQCTEEEKKHVHFFEQSTIFFGQNLLWSYIVIA
jgi:hypothetical protein